MTIFAGLVEIGLSQFIERLRVVFQPAIAGLTVLVVGLQLGLVGISHSLDVPGETLPQFSWHVATALLTLAACIGLSIWGRGVVKLISTMLGLAIGVVIGAFTGLIGPSVVATVSAAPWLEIPDPGFLSYAFDPTLIPAFLAAAVAATLRTIGVVTTCQRINDAEWKRPDMKNVTRGVTGDGLGCLVGGLLGVPGMSSAPSMVGVSSATGATSRVIAYATSAILVLFAFTPKIGAAILSLPLEIAGAVLVFTASFMVVGGIQIIAARGVDLRSGVAVSIALFVGVLDRGEARVFRPAAGSLADVHQQHADRQPFRGDSPDPRLPDRRPAQGRDPVGCRRQDPRQVLRLPRRGGESLEARQRRRRPRHRGRRVDCRPPRRGALRRANRVAIKASYDNLELQVLLQYRGRPLPLSASARGQELAHEEASAVAGLTSFLHGAIADRTSIATHGEDVTIRLGFDA